MLLLSAIVAGLWLALLLVPWRPWSTRESLAPLRAEQAGRVRLDDITALIPARDEACCIASTLRGLGVQGELARIILIDDQSSDGTATVARDSGVDALEIVAGSTPPPGWSGKLWALEQGLARVDSDYVLLLDADIELAPGMLAALAARRDAQGLDLVSIMASLHMGNGWEKLLLPPFIFFFKLLYPFALANEPRSRVAAAAGGCILLRTAALRALGGFEALHDAIIDDCTLASRIKRAGGRTWLGLSRDVRAIRPYATLANIWNMVARTAFTQLRYSTALLVLCTAMLALSFGVPLAALAAGDAATACGLLALAALTVAYWPTVRYYGLAPGWALTLPCAAVLFLAMTWTSALRYWRGERSRWKNRSYERHATGAGGEAGNPAPSSDSIPKA
ncbi:MAG: glycosyltransferase [Gammaproteobacteria bacterium]